MKDRIKISIPSRCQGKSVLRNGMDCAVIERNIEEINKSKRDPFRELHVRALNNIAEDEKMGFCEFISDHLQEVPPNLDKPIEIYEAPFPRVGPSLSNCIADNESPQYDHTWEGEYAPNFEVGTSIVGGEE